jgi:hypothetical protein
MVCVVFMREQTTEELIAEAKELLRKLKEGDIVLKKWLHSPGTKLENAEELLMRRKVEKILKQIFILLALLIAFLIGLYGLTES